MFNEEFYNRVFAILMDPKSGILTTTANSKLKALLDEYHLCLKDGTIVENNKENNKNVQFTYEPSNYKDEIHNNCLNSRSEKEEIESKLNYSKDIEFDIFEDVLYDALIEANKAEKVSISDVIKWSRKLRQSYPKTSKE